MDVVVELGRGDGSAAWTVALLSASTWMAATLYPKHVVDNIFRRKIPHGGCASAAQGEDKTRGWWGFDRGRIVEF
jgi:3-hydroxy-9,10-secoandrosta-1,3,5(10)-triene-9,17-dione monooxygenase